MSNSVSNRLEQQITFMQSVISSADQKAVFVLAASAILLNRDAATYHWLGVLSQAFGALTILSSILVVFPRTSYRSDSKTVWDEISNVNQENIGIIFQEKYIEKCINTTTFLSKVISEKHRATKISLFFLALQVVFMLIDKLMPSYI